MSTPESPQPAVTNGPPETQRRKLFTRGRFLISAGVGVCGLGYYASRIEPHWLQIVRRKMPVRNLPRELAGTTLLQASVSGWHSDQSCRC